MTAAPPDTTDTFGQRVDRAFARVAKAVWYLIPRPLRQRIPVSFVGFALINGFTFSVDVGLLALLYRGVGLPHPIAITIGYVAGFGLAFVLNRRFNFHSHGPVAGQVARWVLVVAVNYVALVLGLGSGLVLIGVPFLLARLIAAGAEAIWMYSMMRWWVFADRRTSAGTRPT